MNVKAISLPYIFQVNMYVLCFTRPRYQVSVYRTIGPLVFAFLSFAESFVVEQQALFGVDLIHISMISDVKVQC